MNIISKIISLFGSLYSSVAMPKNIQKGKFTCLSYCDGHSVKGRDNYLKIGEYARLNHCRFIIKGNNNKIIVGDRCILTGVTFWISGDKNEIILGDDTTVGNNSQFAALEETKIIVGYDCMLSHDILVRTSDSHSIVNSAGERINPAKDIVIGNHVWVGLQALILKGSVVSDNTVIAARSIVSRKFDEQGCVIAGIPASVVNKNISWDRKKL